MCVSFEKRLIDGEELNTLVVLTMEKALNMKKNPKQRIQDTFTCGMSWVTLTFKTRVWSRLQQNQQLDKVKLCKKCALGQEELQSLSKTINLTKNTKIVLYMPVPWREMNSIFGKAKYNQLRIILDTGKILPIIIGKHMHKM